MQSYVFNIFIYLYIYIIYLYSIYIYANIMLCVSNIHTANNRYQAIIFPKAILKACKLVNCATKIYSQKKHVTQNRIPLGELGELQNQDCLRFNLKVIATKWPNRSIWSNYSDLTRKGSFFGREPRLLHKTSRLVKYYSIWHRSWPVFSLDVRVSSLAGFKLFATSRL